MKKSVLGVLLVVAMGLMASTAFAADAKASWDVSFTITGGASTVTVKMPSTSATASTDFVSFDVVSLDTSVTELEKHFAKKKGFITAPEVTVTSAANAINFVIEYTKDNVGASFDIEHALWLNIPDYTSTSALLISDDAGYSKHSITTVSKDADLFGDKATSGGIDVADNGLKVTLKSVARDMNVYLWVKPGNNTNDAYNHHIVVKVPLKYKFTSGGDSSISLINPAKQLDKGLVKMMTSDGERPMKYAIMKAFNLSETDDIDKVSELTDQFSEDWTPVQMEEFCKMFYSDVTAPLAEEGQRVAVVFPAITIEDTSLVYAFEAKLVGLAKGQSLELHAYKAGVPNALMNAATDDVIADAVFVDSNALPITATGAADQKIAIAGKVAEEGDYIFYLTTSDEEEPTTEPSSTPSGTPTPTPTAEPTTTPSGTPTTTPSGTPTTTPTTTPRGGSSSSSGGCDMGLVSGLAILLAALLPLRKVRK